MRKERREVNKGLRVKQGLGQGTRKEKNVVRGLAKTKCVGKKKTYEAHSFYSCSGLNEKCTPQ